MDDEIQIRFSGTPKKINMSKDLFANLSIIDVQIGSHVISMGFDTGGSITCISESVSAIIGATSLNESVKIGGNANIHIAVSKSLIGTMKIGDNIIENIPVIVLPDKSFDIGLDENGNALKVNGFLGWDIIKCFRWTLDCINRVFTIEEPAKFEMKGNLYWDNMPIIKVNFNNNSLYFGFDTGNTESMFGQHFLPFLQTKREGIDILVGLDGFAEEKVWKVDNIELLIGKKAIELTNVSVLNRDVFPTNEYTVMGLLASDIIQNHKCVIDFMNQNFEIL